MVELEHETDGVATQAGATGFIQTFCGVPRNLHVAAGGLFKQTDDVEQGAFPRARWAFESHKLALGQRQVDAVQNLGLHWGADAVAFANVLQAKDVGHGVWVQALMA
jgi:hypothetical protein